MLIGGTLAGSVRSPTARDAKERTPMADQPQSTPEEQPTKVTTVGSPAGNGAARHGRRPGRIAAARRRRRYGDPGLLPRVEVRGRARRERRQIRFRSISWRAMMMRLQLVGALADDAAAGASR